MSAFPKLSSSAVDLPRNLFGYDVIDIIGTGAGSTIYAVSQPQTRQLFALKHVVRNTDHDARFVTQLENEHDVGRQVNHPILRKSIELKEERTILRKVTQAALLMELFDGIPLDLELPAELRDVVQVFILTAQGLESLHQMGYVHCDLKPNNILLGRGGTVKVIDLGQTCPIGTEKQRIQGTPDYIAPEQVKRLPVTPRTDVFNLGATMYWALTSQKLPTLFTLKKGENSFLLDEYMNTPRSIKPDIPEALSTLVMECVRTNPAKRPEGMGEVIRRLETVKQSLEAGQLVRSAG